MEIDKVALLHTENGKVLATVSRGKDVFYFPGGKREQGETDEETLIREVKEELSVDVVSESIRYYGIFKSQAHGKPEGTTVKMSCYTARFIGELKASGEIEKILWVDSSNIEEAPPVDKLILRDLKQKDLID